ncbi:DUF397 domain-containing protein [Nocardiopsis sp. CNT312]|uniref:DUF397 domain-containing protein n=1 Tax=Nocardiopsis sp. CNT312 TaxID=1137268 RepID=UPI00048A4BC9|nr:DUF397 domain-containing protein [Nocardiopsis sp. CNT312]
MTATPPPSRHPRFHKSSYSQSEAACVEVAEGPVTGVRDTKHRELGALFFDTGEWRAFLASTKDA